MYQQRLENEKSTARMDFILVAVFLIMMIFLRRIVDFCATLPAPWNGIVQIAIFLVLIGICLFTYKQRICSYRYTVIHSEPEEGELNDFGEQLRWPWPIGTVLFERMVANKGKITEQVAPEELLALLPPGEAVSVAALGMEKAASPNSLNCAHLTRKSAKTAHLLAFVRGGKLFYIRFHPDAQFIEYIEALLAAKREAQAAQAERSDA